jgi:hypothetical protein
MNDMPRSKSVQSAEERALEDADDIEVAKARLADEADEWVPLERVVADERR